MSAAFADPQPRHLGTQEGGLSLSISRLLLSDKKNDSNGAETALIMEGMGVR